MLKIGIVGLPNVGKSSLFSLLTKSDSVLIANYPFATIEPHVGVVLLPDARIERLGKLFPRAKKIAPPVRFWDIAGLVREAHKGAGLGNSFLSNIREADAIIHVVRAFLNEKIIHVEGVVSPFDDWETIRLELLFRDRETIRNAKQKLSKDRSPEGTAKKKLLEQILARIESRMEFDEKNTNAKECELLDSLDLLSRKPKAVLFNVASEEFSKAASNESIQKLTSHLKAKGIPFFFLAVEFELMIRDEEPAAAAALRADFGIGTENLDRLIQISYELLDQATFFTAGDKEIRGWSFPRGMRARECAGRIHSDMERGFIRAEVVPATKLIDAGSWARARDQGVVRSEGANYLFQDGDVALFHFSAPRIQTGK